MSRSPRPSCPHDRVRGWMNRISQAALAALLSCVAAPMCFAATPEEIRLLGSDREDAQFQAYMPFTRASAASGIVTGSLARSAEAAGVPPAAMVEAINALGAGIDLERELRDGDRFYVRYERTYTAEGNPVGVVGRLAATARTSCARKPRAPSRSIASAPPRPPKTPSGCRPARLRQRPRSACRSPASPCRRASACAPIRSTSRCAARPRRRQDPAAVRRRSRARSPTR